MAALPVPATPAASGSVTEPLVALLTELKDAVVKLSNLHTGTPAGAGASAQEVLQQVQGALDGQHGTERPGSALRDRSNFAAATQGPKSYREMGASRHPPVDRLLRSSRESLPSGSSGATTMASCRRWWPSVGPNAPLPCPCPQQDDSCVDTVESRVSSGPSGGSAIKSVIHASGRGLEQLLRNQPSALAAFQQANQQQQQQGDKFRWLWSTEQQQQQQGAKSARSLTSGCLLEIRKRHFGRSDM